MIRHTDLKIIKLLRACDRWLHDDLSSEKVFLGMFLHVKEDSGSSRINAGLHFALLKRQYCS
jgi:hypothetical protein